MKISVIKKQLDEMNKVSASPSLSANILNTISSTASSTVKFFATFLRLSIANSEPSALQNFYDSLPNKESDRELERKELLKLLKSIGPASEASRVFSIEVFAAIQLATRRPVSIIVGKEKTTSVVSDPGHNRESEDTTEVRNKIREVEAYSAPLLSTHESIRKRCF